VNDTTRARLIADLKEDEGRRPRPYLDSLGHWTVGFGHNLEQGPPLSERAMAVILDDDLAVAERDCERLTWLHALNDVRQAVIVNMVFNMGLGTFGKFRKMIAALEMGDWASAADEMLDSRWAVQVGRDPGERAYRLAEEMRTGEWA
jgi:lysozyme